MEISFLSDDLISARKELLQQSLRPGFNDYSIELEYPIVLNPAFRHFSLCLYDWQTPNQVQTRDPGKKTLLAHANLWPRVLIETSSQRRIPLGLVGNVATLSHYRGRGIMRQLFANIWEKAMQSGLEAIILWSDLVAFYHKLGFESCGQERRWFFAAAKLQALRHPYKLVAMRGQEVSDRLLTKLLAWRYPTAAHLERSLDEYRLLLGIPDMVVVLARRGADIQGYGIVGKGCDMVGMIHEWGVLENSALLAILQHIAVKTGWPEVALLSPHSIASAFGDLLAPFLLRQEVHPMALVKAREDSSVLSILNQGFLWGLDSI